MERSMGGYLDKTFEAIGSDWNQNRLEYLRKWKRLFFTSRWEEEGREWWVRAAREERNDHMVTKLELNAEAFSFLRARAGGHRWQRPHWAPSAGAGFRAGRDQGPPMVTTSFREWVCVAHPILFPQPHRKQPLSGLDVPQWPPVAETNYLSDPEGAKNGLWAKDVYRSIFVSLHRIKKK